MKTTTKLGRGTALLSFIPLLLGVLLAGPAAQAGGNRALAAARSANFQGAMLGNRNFQRATLSTLTTTAPVSLGTAGTFVILSKSGITDVPTSGVTGNVGTSPITGAADHLTCKEVTGSILSVDAAGPAPCSLINPGLLTKAVLAMQAAYTDAAGRAPGVTGLRGGNLGGLTLSPGVYKWSTGVIIPTALNLRGSSSSVWIFQIAQNLSIASGVSVVLSGGAQAKNVFWQVAGSATLGTTSKFQGIILSKTLIAMQTGASINGKLFAQTAVTLQMNSVSIH